MFLHGLCQFILSLNSRDLKGFRYFFKFFSYEIKERTNIIKDSGEAYGFYNSNNVKSIECELWGVETCFVLPI